VPDRSRSCAKARVCLVLALKRLRIGRVSLARMPEGEWRYLPAGERF
jgi:16S rRNA U516 pseudouridylate synthase RsuA-like enzyme